MLQDENTASTVPEGHGRIDQSRISKNRDCYEIEPFITVQRTEMLRTFDKLFFFLIAGHEDAEVHEAGEADEDGREQGEGRGEDARDDGTLQEK